MKEQLLKEINEAYIFLRTNNNTIPDETLKFILEAANEKVLESQIQDTSKGWIDVKDGLPEKGSNVIAFDGKIRHICFWIPKHYEEFECDEEDCHLFDYDEPNDKTYWVEGWYSDEEQFGGYYDSFWIKRDITKWMELPKPPQTIEPKEEKKIGWCMNAFNGAKKCITQCDACKEASKNDNIK